MAAPERDTSFDLNDEYEEYGYAPNLDLPVPTPNAPAHPPVDTPAVGMPRPAGGAAAFVGFLQAPDLDFAADEFDAPQRPTVTREPAASPAARLDPLPPEPDGTGDEGRAIDDVVAPPPCPDSPPPDPDDVADVTPTEPADGGRRNAYRLPNEIHEAASRSGLFALLRRIDATATHAPRLGEAMRPQQDVVRVWQRPTTGFAPADVESLDAVAPDRAERLTVNTGGMFGAGGPLPLVFVSHIEERLAAGDSTLADFINALTHRLATVRYRAWAEHQRTVQHDRPGDDRFLNQLLSLIGLGVPELRDADTVPDAAKAFMCGRLAMPGRNPEGLAEILSWFFGVPCEIEEFATTQVPLPESDWRSVGGQRPAVLGRHAPLGRSAWQAQQKFHIVLGPMTLDQYEKLLPDKVGLQQVRDWVKMYLGVELEWDVRLAVKRSDVPKPKLGQYGRLGWTTWLANKPAKRDRDDLVMPSTPVVARSKPKSRSVSS